LNLQVAGAGTTANVQIGSGAGSGTPDLMVLDIKNTAGNPAGTAGAMYYNSNDNKFRCYENGVWKDCDTAGTQTLQAAYNGGATITTAGGTAITFTTPTTSNNVGLVINQNNNVNNPVAFQITNAGTGNDITATNWSVSKNGNIGTSGNVTTTGAGIITSAGTLTASNGLTMSTGALNLTATSGALALSGLGASSINTGVNNLTITSGNFNTTATGINSTAIGATTASTGRFTSVTSPLVIGSTSANGTLTLEGNNTTGNTLTNPNLIFKVGESAGTTAMTILNNGKIGLGVTSPTANLQIATTANGTLSFGDAFPNKSANTDSGIGLYNLPSSVSPAFKMGLFTEVTGQLLSYGINVSQIGDRDTTKTGAIFRMDTRATSPYFSVKRQAIGGSLEYSDLQISQAGDLGLGGWASDTNSFPGTVSILARGAAIPGLIVRGAAVQTANLTEWQNSTGTVLSSVNSAGALTIGQSGRAITRHLSATAAINIPSLGSDSCANTNFTVTNAAVGDTVVATPTPVAGGIETLLLMWNAWVSGANTVTIRACNANSIFAGSQDPANQTWRVDVWQH
jgi:hypothetical protein